MIEIKAEVIGARWLYASRGKDGGVADEVIVSELRPSVDTIIASGVDLLAKVNLVMTLVCDEIVYGMEIPDLTLGMARDITDDLITSRSTLVRFESDGTVSALLIDSRSYVVTDSELIGLRSALDDDG
jgi:hypothetical protein